jgi:hypothetical protein
LNRFLRQDIDEAVSREEAMKALRAAIASATTK